jgi:hypothetical protein
MTAPRVVPLEQLAPHGRRGLPSSGAAVLVVSAGTFGGLELKAGDVLRCAGSPRSGRVAALVDRSGQAQLGSVRGEKLYGDAGEPRSPSRWGTIGEVVAVVRGDKVLTVGADGGWRVNLPSDPAELRSGEAANRPGPQGPVQLGLFARAA